MVKTPFYLFEGPLILTRQFELQRIASNLLNGLRYRYFVEKNLNQQSFEVGLKSGIARLAGDIREQRFDDIVKIGGKDLQSRLKLRVPEIPQTVLDKRLSFEVENVRNIFIHSCFFSTTKVVVAEDSHKSFHVTAVGFIDPSATGPISNFELGRRINEMLVCNITYSRLIEPMGRWRITDVNFFDAAVVPSKAVVFV